MNSGNNQLPDFSRYISEMTAPDQSRVQEQVSTAMIPAQQYAVSPQIHYSPETLALIRRLRGERQVLSAPQQQYVPRGLLGYGPQLALPSAETQGYQQPSGSDPNRQPPKNKRGRRVATALGGLAATGLLVVGGMYAKSQFQHEQDPVDVAAAAIKAAENTPPSYTASLLTGCVDVATASFTGNGLINIPLNPYTKTAKPELVKNALTQTQGSVSVEGAIQVCDPAPTAKDKKPLTVYENGMYTVDRSVLKATFAVKSFNCANPTDPTDKACYTPKFDNLYVDKKAADLGKIAFNKKDTIFTDLKDPESKRYKTYSEAISAKFVYLGIQAVADATTDPAFQKSIDMALEQFLLSNMPSQDIRKKVAGRFQFEGGYATPAKDYAAKMKKQLDNKIADVAGFQPTIHVTPVVPKKAGV